jgi:hypothetical protein
LPLELHDDHSTKAVDFQNIFSRLSDEEKLSKFLAMAETINQLEKRLRKIKKAKIIGGGGQSKNCCAETNERISTLIDSCKLYF